MATYAQRQPDRATERAAESSSGAALHPALNARSAVTQAQAVAAQLNARSEPVQRRPSRSDGLPDPLRASMEAMSGIALDDVRVHRNSDKPAQMQAHAYAQGTDIHLGPGQERHLPHEAWHVVQQKQGRVRATGEVQRVAINDDPGLEREADAMGSMATSMRHSAEPPTQVGSATAAIIQCTRITDRLDVSDEAWSAVEDRTRETNQGYGSYEAAIRSLDNTFREPAGFAAATGVAAWANNFRNKSLAYLQELQTAILRSGGTRLAALGTNTTTEPDMFILREGDDIAVQQTSIFGLKDHIEIKRTEGSSEDIKKLVRNATHQLLARQNAQSRNYIVEMHAPAWYPVSSAETDEMSFWALKWIHDHISDFRTDNPQAYGSFIIRIYYAQASVPITVRESIPHGQ